MKSTHTLHIRYDADDLLAAASGLAVGSLVGGVIGGIGFGAVVLAVPMGLAGALIGAIVRRRLAKSAPRPDRTFGH